MTAGARRHVVLGGVFVCLAGGVARFSAASDLLLVAGQRTLHDDGRAWSEVALDTPSRPRAVWAAALGEA